MSTKNDPVAAKSTFLCMYMSNHPDTLVAYVRYFGQIKESVSKAQMMAIDSTGMTLQYEVNNTGVKKDVRVAFDPPLLGYEEVKPRLIAMTADAQESLGMIKTPQVITITYLNPDVLFVGSAVAFLTYITVARSFEHGELAPFFVFGNAFYRLIGPTIFKIIWGVVVTLHSAEALYVASLCRKHTSFGLGLQYVLGTTFVGFPFFGQLRKRIQQARIDSIMKGN